MEKKTAKSTEKATEVKKKASEIKNEVKKEVKKAVKETKANAEKAVKAVEKTADTVKTRSKKKAAPTVKMIVEYAGSQTDMEMLVTAAKADWVANGHDEKNFDSCELYVKPEEGAAYYVINGYDGGKIQY